MATHDYVIANGTGAAVRSDLNGALAAIVSNNSDPSEPATMYAYQWWPDTTTGLLKIRNSANSAWVTVGTLASTNLGLLPVAGGTMTGVLAVTAGTAALPGIAVSGDPNTGLFSPGADQLAISTNGVEAARIDSSNRLLVGATTTSAACNALLQATGGSGGTLILSRNAATPADGEDLGFISFNDSSHIYNNAVIRAQRDGGTWNATTSKPTRLVFSTTADGAASPTERMRISQNGHVNIGAASPSDARLRIDADASLIQPMAINDSSNTATQTHRVSIKTGNTEVGSIKATNSATSFVTSSDYRLKENVTAVTDGIARIQQLKPSRFNFIVDPENTVDGFIAHEVQEVVSEAITGTKDEVGEDGNPVYQGIDQSKLVPLLTAALQEAIAKIEALETRLSALEAA